MSKPRQPLAANTLPAASHRQGTTPARAASGAKRKRSRPAANAFPPPAARRKPAPAGNVRLTLLEAVGEIIREQGIGFVSLREVARRAKVSHAAPAHYFRNKEGLFTAFAAHGYEMLARSVVEAMSRSGASDGPTSLEAVGAGYVRFAVDHPEHFTIMFRPASTLELDNPDFLMAREAAYGVLTSTLQRCAREGYLDGIDPELAGIAAWSIVHGLASLWLSGRLRERVSETQADRLGHKVAKLFVDAVLRKKLRPRR